MDEFLDDKDKAILRSALLGVNPEGFWRFWSWEELQLDGDFKLPELLALVNAM